MKKKLFVFLKIIFTSIILFFLGKFFYSNINNFRQTKIEINWFLFFLSFVILFIFLICQIFIWFYITKINKCSINLLKTFQAYSYSTLTKYVPGRIITLTSFFYFYSKELCSKKKVAYCLLIEAICSLLSASLIFLLSILFTNFDNFDKYKIPTLFLTIFFFILINPKIINFFLNLILKIFKKEIIKLEITYKHIIQIIILYSLNWLFFGLAFFILINSIFPFSFKYFFFSTGAFSLASIVGYLAFFTPSGLGVREGIVIFTLGSIIPITIASTVSIISRLWVVLTELILAFVIYFATKKPSISICTKKTY